MFQPKTLFYAGLKIIGVLAIIWSLTLIFPVLFQFYSVYNQPNMMPGNDLSYFRFSLIFQVVYPILTFIIGIYLLSNGEAIVKLAFRDSNEKSTNEIGVLFVLFMKLAGLTLIIYAIPKAFQILSNVLFVSSVNVIDSSNQMKFIVQHFVTTTISLIFGFYLLRSGKIFYRLGFSKQEDADEEMKW
ncbi:hypothetical protein CIB95_04955 [Lottiidibacillus patelloidae]|uniref:Uncharacterized protein n=1 Tax=Lottiidibacillus patelloidae TaxID=2670334 RepID=A0A263BWM0_9BACI|nr:hypothetical protein [Lottiidibacillus patelloidae]OZM57717.1 hypothetical protein CIB95_04955 [Lottiidibacillus patelloidae]